MLLSHYGSGQVTVKIDNLPGSQFAALPPLHSPDDMKHRGLGEEAQHLLRLRPEDLSQLQGENGSDVTQSVREWSINSKN